MSLSSFVRSFVLILTKNNGTESGAPSREHKTVFDAYKMHKLPKVHEMHKMLEVLGRDAGQAGALATRVPDSRVPSPAAPEQVPGSLEPEADQVF